MCQLLGMNSAAPTKFNFCFKGFCERGGGTDRHKDGWGLALYEGRGLRTFLDVKACAKSPVARFIQAYPTTSQNVVAHIRCATHGRVGLENCHPFTRELWGIAWTFAHNGNVSIMCHQCVGHHVCLGRASHDDLIFHAIGDTDSEALFCAILNGLRAEFHEIPTLPVLFLTLQKLANELVQKDDTLINNFLLGVGPHTLFCYSWPGQQQGSTVWNGLYYIVREPPLLHTARLVDLDYSVEFDIATESDRMAVIATKPLTDEKGWLEMNLGELIMFNNGIAYTDSTAIERVEVEGRGLSSRCFRKSTI